ncbi:NUDIX hydrolase [Microvirga antarctica]|uniref:NUDIX hydrolase n=1 Tax=Microvirga antarctica TaxID=2819233 RepID=UPI001B306414|nr:NUDIX hydrolase [Microvirga antarctica]
MIDRAVSITRVAAVEAHHDSRVWPWAEANRAAIATNWQRRIADKPRMFNGRVLLLCDLSVDEDVCRSRYFETDYADFIGWIDAGYPDPGVANGFAMGALRGSDGAYICGVMGDHTVNAGRVYFAAGTPDQSDIRQGGRVDLATSLTRELTEETGLVAADFEVADDWIVVQHWPTVALMRHVTLAVTAEVGAERIRGLIKQQDDQELSDVVVVRGPDDINPGTMPLYLQSFFRWSFAQR